MNQDQYREALQALGLNNPDRAAQFLRINSRTVRRMKAGEEVPFAVAALLTVMLVKNLTPDDVEEMMRGGSKGGLE